MVYFILQHWYDDIVHLSKYIRKLEFEIAHSEIYKCKMHKHKMHSVVQQFHL